jgi:hypothetical protein
MSDHANGLIVLTWRKDGKPAAVFSTPQQMRRWLNSMGFGAGHAFVRHNHIPVNPERRS